MKRYFDLSGISGDSLLMALDRQVTEEGLSVETLMEVLERYGFRAKAYRDKKLYEKTPFIMLDVKRRHYYLIEKMNRKQVFVFDPNFGTVRLCRVFWRFLWSEYYITLCYNLDN